MDRLEQVRQVVDGIFRQQADAQLSRCGFVHLYGVSAACVMLADKRGLDRELIAVAGMLHDISSYRLGDHTDHGKRSALEAGVLLQDMGLFSQEEIGQITNAIACHCSKNEIHDQTAECLKDADVFQHYLYNPGMHQQYADRLQKVMAELGL